MHKRNETELEQSGMGETGEEGGEKERKNEPAGISERGVTTEVTTAEDPQVNK